MGSEIAFLVPCAVGFLRRDVLTRFVSGVSPRRFTLRILDVALNLSMVRLCRTDIDVRRRVAGFVGVLPKRLTSRTFGR